MDGSAKTGGGKAAGGPTTVELTSDQLVAVGAPTTTLAEPICVEDTGLLDISISVAVSIKNFLLEMMHWLNHINEAWVGQWNEAMADQWREAGLIKREGGGG